MSSTLHTSVYTIYIELESENKCLLVHGYTGAIDVTGNEVAEFLRKGGVVTSDSLSGGHHLKGDTVRALKNRGYLTDLTSREEREYVSNLANFLHIACAKHSSFLFLVVYDCNFSCPYCFERGISGFGSQWSRHAMTKELVDRAFKAMLEINPTRDLHDNNITLFGGEPFLVENHDIISYLVERGMRERYWFTAVTNGYSIDRYQDLVKPGMIQFLQVTLDGTREVHDRYRVHRSNGKTFDRIMENIDIALQAGVTVCVRLNTAGGDASEILDLSDEFIRRGWPSTGRFSAYSSQIRVPFDAFRIRPRSIFRGSEVPYTMTRETPCDQASILGNPVADEFTGGARKDFVAVGDGFELGLWNRIRRSFRGESWALFRVDYCGARTGMVVFDPNGDLYACLETVGKPEHRIGTFGGTFEMRSTQLAKWRGWKFEYERCRCCQFALFCGGGCPALSVLRENSDHSDRCDRFKVIFLRLVQKAYGEFSVGDHPHGTGASDWKTKNQKQNRKEREDESRRRKEEK